MSDAPAWQKKEVFATQKIRFWGLYKSHETQQIRKKSLIGNYYLKVVTHFMTNSLSLRK